MSTRIITPTPEGKRWQKLFKGKWIDADHGPVACSRTEISSNMESAQHYPYIGAGSGQCPLWRLVDA